MGALLALAALALLAACHDEGPVRGTSMASPHVAGVAALVRGKNPSLSPDQVREILQASAVDLGTPGWDPVFGYGLVNAKKAVEITR